MCNWYPQTSLEVIVFAITGNPNLLITQTIVEWMCGALLKYVQKNETAFSMTKISFFM